ncbi:MAG: LCP family protein [Christensenellales bacterium]|jgi:LCP family protein required for cell wall assembly
MKKFLTLTLALLTLFSLTASAQTEALVFTQEQLDALDVALSDDNSEIIIGDEFRVHISDDDLSVTPDLPSEWVNILLLGTDTGNKTLNYGRTDTMMVFSVNKSTGQMRLASLVRDMYVNIPHLNSTNRINTANVFGGPLYAVKVVNETLGLNITHYASVNFQGFKDIIDYLGGVTLKLGFTEANIVGAQVTEEPQLLNGEQALAYARIRQLDSNFGRNTRQRKLLNAMLSQLLSGSDINQIMSAMTEALKHLTTNMTINEVLQLVPAVVKNESGMETAGFPAAGDYRNEMIRGVKSVVIFDQEETKDKLHRFIYEGIQP